MKVAVFSTKPYEEAALLAFNKDFDHELVFFKEPLTKETVSLAAGYPAVCTFVNDSLDAPALKLLAEGGTKLIALRCAGHDSVDLKAASANNITVMRVPAYSPYAIAEFTLGILLAQNRKIPNAWQRVQTGDFHLNGLVGNDFHGKTVGILGTGRIGAAVARIFKLGFQCDVLANDLYPSAEMESIGVRYVDRETIFTKADVISLHCPLTKETKGLINAKTLDMMKPNVYLVNTSRGGLVDTAALADALESGRIRGAALDVYEGERALFFRKLSLDQIDDPLFKRLIKLPNFLLTGHQAFLTQEAIDAIATITLTNISNFSIGKLDKNVAVEKYS
ncbi:hypothetical protein AJ80_00474 [Polytolypa hystricis UAMH7299]|uniref:D-lactate dehydrogenase n=1 Tax=Polytolypa hystricis (strain UAMH7299) TaxID=1447883 RepID=A0A2B7YV24_POLH7|nr:hypothetical protein AJ80_00474 [Polytolypa hystricis UAMH7299]